MTSPLADKLNEFWKREYNAWRANPQEYEADVRSGVAFYRYLEKTDKQFAGIHSDDAELFEEMLEAIKLWKHQAS